MYLKTFWRINLFFISIYENNEITFYKRNFLFYNTVELKLLEITTVNIIYTGTIFRLILSEIIPSTHTHSFRLVLLSGRKSSGRKSPKTKEKWFFAEVSRAGGSRWATSNSWKCCVFYLRILRKFQKNLQSPIFLQFRDIHGFLL